MKKTFIAIAIGLLSISASASTPADSSISQLEQDRTTELVLCLVASRKGKLLPSIQETRRKMLITNLIDRAPETDSETLAIAAWLLEKKAIQLFEENLITTPLQYRKLYNSNCK